MLRWQYLNEALMQFAILAEEVSENDVLVHVTAEGNDFRRRFEATVSGLNSDWKSLKEHALAQQFKVRARVAGARC